MSNKVLIKEVVGYKGHSISANGSVNLTLKAAYEEITNSVGLLQMLNNDVTIKANAGGEKLNLGSFRIKSITFDGDGESVLKFNSITDFVSVGDLSKLVTPDPFKVMFAADIENEDGSDEED